MYVLFEVKVFTYILENDHPVSRKCLITNYLISFSITEINLRLIF